MFDLGLRWRPIKRLSVKSEAEALFAFYFNDSPRTKIRKQLLGPCSPHGRLLNPPGKSHAPVVLFLKAPFGATIRLILNFGARMGVARVQTTAPGCAC